VIHPGGDIVTSGPAIRVGAILRRSAPALVVATVLLLPFLDKAFTIDDPVFLAEARHSLTDPLHPTAFDMAWKEKAERVSVIVPTGPLMAWLLVPAVLSAHPEMVAHGIQIGMLWIAIIATVGLALRLGLSPGWAAASGLLLGVTPAVLGMAGTAMPDVTAMALGVAGLEQVVAWRQERRLRQGIAAALLLGLAPLARTHLVLLLGVAALLQVGDVLSLREWFRFSWAEWLPILAAPLLTGAVSVATQDPGPGSSSVAMAAAGFSSTDTVIPNLLAFAIHWFLALPFAIPWVLLRWRPILGRAEVLVLATGIAALFLRHVHPVDTPWVLAPVAGLSAAALIDVLVDAVERKDDTQLTLGTWLFLAFPAAIYVHLPAKYLLASAPAAAILVARAMVASPRLARPTLILATTASAILGVAILQADAAYANVARSAVRSLITPETARGQRVWYAGHWGFQWYAEEAGARYFSIEPPFPEEGDLVVACLNCEAHLENHDTEAFAPLHRIRHEEPGGRLMDRLTGAGFFSNTWGYLPWTRGDTLLEGFDVYRVERRD
jgi:hypothetical protein